MSKLLTLDEMLILTMDIDQPAFLAFKKRTEQLAQEVADHIAEQLNIKCGIAELDVGGVMVGFSPSVAGQDCPEALCDLDRDGDFVFITRPS